jgi:hypothetical protein
MGNGGYFFMKKQKRAFSLPMLILIGVSILFIAICCVSEAVSDFYVQNVFPVISGIYGRLTSLVGFSVGEILLVLVTIYIAVAVLFIIVHTVFMAAGKLKKEETKGYQSLNKRFFLPLSDFFYRGTPYLLTITVVLMTLNCFTLYHTSKLEVVSEGSVSQEYSLEDLTKLRDYIVRKCNDLSEKVPHDENGNVEYSGNMQSVAIASMQKLGDDYPRLSGYYVTPKALYFSDFMCQQYMQGYYFPFSMEANYNDTMNLMNKPFTMCHELAHTHGYIYEDEANFFGFLACIGSDDIVFQYSGYLGVLNYINNDFYRAVSKEEYDRHVKISARVK